VLPTIGGLGGGGAIHGIDGEVGERVAAESRRRWSPRAWRRGGEETVVALPTAVAPLEIGSRVRTVGGVLWLR